jgi:hypothetical protein
MFIGLIARILLIVSVPLLLLSSSFSQERRPNKQLTRQDKAEIVAFVLRDANFETRELRDGETKDVVNLSKENIVPSALPQIRGIKFELITPLQIQQKSKEGFSYYAFQQFKVRGSKVLVRFGVYYRRTNARGGEYEFRKRKGKWIGKEVSGWGEAV